jgi:hypothetical protein
VEVVAVDPIPYLAHRGASPFVDAAKLLLAAVLYATVTVERLKVGAATP